MSSTCTAPTTGATATDHPIRPGTPARQDRDATTARRSILFLGTHGQFNVGDELLLETFLGRLGAQHSYAVNSYAPVVTAIQLGDRFDAGVFDTAGDRRALLRHLTASDAVVFGGGSIVKELYPSVGRWRYSTLAMVLALVVVARVARKPVLMSNVGVGPITTRTGRAFTRAILRCVDLMSVRDDASYRCCLELGSPVERVLRVPDAAFANEPADLTTRREHPHAHSSRTPGRPTLRIALNLNRDIANPDNWEPFLAQLADSLRLVAACVPVEVHALPMQCRFKPHHDLEVLRRFLDDLVASTSGIDAVIHEPVDHREVGDIVVSCDVVVSERLHAIVIAASLGTPVVGLAYDVKVTELVDQLGIAGRSVDVNRWFDPAELAGDIVWTARSDDGRRLELVAAAHREVLDDYFAEVREWITSPHRRGWSAELRSTSVGTA